MTPHVDGKITMSQLLLPINLIAFSLMILFAFQTTQILRDRYALHETKGQQEQAFTEGQRLLGQVNALVSGTQKLADQGNKNAKQIADKLRELGVIVNQSEEKAQPEAAPAPAPAP